MDTVPAVSAQSGPSRIIPHPYSHLASHQRDQIPTHVDPAVTNYFRRATGGSRGVLTAVLATLLKSIYDECHAAGIPERWEPDNESRIAEILGRVNYRPAPAPAKRVKSRRAASPPAQSPS